VIGYATRDLEISQKWRSCCVSCRPANLSWPAGRWALLPARGILPARVHHWRRMKLPLLIQSSAMCLAGAGDRR
jgi:hypothetical protein